MKTLRCRLLMALVALLPVLGCGYGGAGAGYGYDPFYEDDYYYDDFDPFYDGGYYDDCFC